MNYRTLLGVCAAISILASGCAAKPTEQSSGVSAPAAAQTKQSTQQPAASNAPQGSKETNREAFQMRATFQGLIAMDKADGLAITKEQAQSMLPIVQESVTSGTLAADAQTKLTEKLTAEQKKYLEQMPQRGPGGQRQPQAQGDGSKPSSSAAPAPGQQGSKPDGADKQNPPAAAGSEKKPSAASSDDNDKQNQPQQQQGDKSGGKSADGKEVAQQLVQLLQAKLKEEGQKASQ